MFLSHGVLWYTWSMRAMGRIWIAPNRLAARFLSRHRALWAITLAALVLRLFRLGFQPLWWDEGWSLYFARTSLGDLLELTAVDIHPPLYYLILRIWTDLFGASPVTVRVLSVLIGLTSIPVLYAVGRRLIPQHGGPLAALLLAVSPFHVYYSQEVRMYGLVALLCLLAFLFSLQIADGNKRRAGPWLAYVLSATAALYSEYYAGFFLLALNLVFFAGAIRARRPLKDLSHWIGAQLAILALFAPWLWYAGGKLASYVRFKVSVEGDPPLGPLAYLGRHLAAFGWGHAEGELANWWWVGLLPAIVLVAGLALFQWRRSARVEVLPPSDRLAASPLISHHTSWAILLIILACGYAVNRLFPFTPPRLERLLLLGLPFYLLTLSVGLVALWERRWLATLPLAVFLFVSLLALGSFYTVPRYPDDDYRPLAADLRALALPTDVIVCVHPWQVGYFQAYLPRDRRPSLTLTPREVLPRERQLWTDDPALMAVDLNRLLGGHGRLWLPAHQTMGRILEEQIDAHLAEQAYPVYTEWYGENTVLSMYATAEPQEQSVKALFGDWLALDGGALSPGPLESGWGVVAIDLIWRLTERPGERYHVGLRLVDEAGRLWAQRDSTPGGGLKHFFNWPLDQPTLDRHGLLVPAGTPPGTYQVTLRVYRSHDLAVIPVAFAEGSSGEVMLGSVRVVRPQSAPPIDALPMEEAIQADFSECCRLLGFSLADKQAVLPGEVIQIDLFWQALVDPGQDYLPHLQLLGSEGQILADLLEKPVSNTYPTAWWQAADLVRDPHQLPVPAGVPPGRSMIALGLVRAADGLPLETEGQQALVLPVDIDVRGRQHVYWPPIASHPQKAQLGASVELIGYDLREVARSPGSPLEITVFWHAIETPDRSYHSFVHLLDTSAIPMRIVAQHDGPPGSGELPTLGWLPGEYLTDTHLLQLPFDLPDGSYRLGVGLYDPVTNERLGERILLDAEIPVTSIGGCNCR